MARMRTLSPRLTHFRPVTGCASKQMISPRAQKMASIYSRGNWQEHLVNEIQNPLKEVLANIGRGKKWNLRNLRLARRIYNCMVNMPDPTPGDLRTRNMQIAAEVREEMWRHLHTERMAEY